MNFQSYKKNFIFLLLGCLLCLMFFSARWSLANIYAYQAIKQLELWYLEKPVHIDTTVNAMEWIIKARKLDTNNPELMSFQAQIFEWQARLSTDKNASLSYLASAAQLYRDSLATRPTWPFDWVALADIKAQLNQFDPEFSRAIERSSTLGPWEYPIQLRLVNTGFKHWKQLTSSEQDIIQQTFDRALYGNRRKPFIDLAKYYDQLALFCARTNNAEAYGKAVENYACKH